MTPTVLGISALYHDSAAAIVKGGDIIAAAQEERFSRKKHDARFPRNAINYCLGEAFIEPDDLDAIVFYDHPLWTLDRVLESVIATAPNSRNQWLKAGRSILGNKLFVEESVRKILKTAAPLFYAEHHASHAASAFYPSPYKEAAVLTFDGVGEWATTTLGVGEGERLELLKAINFPHSIGLLYSAFTYFCGFKVNSGEYKLMGLAPYGEPKYVDLIRAELIDICDDGSYKLNLDYFGFLDSDRMTNDRFADLFDGPERKAESQIGRREMDLAASIQVVTEKIVLKTARYLRDLTGKPNLVMAGGVALNCVANGLLARANIFENIWIQPAAGDAGGSLGAALLASFQKFGVRREIGKTARDSQKGTYLGPAFSSDQIRAYLDRNRYPFERVENVQTRSAVIASALADGKIVGFFAGRMEFGARSLGARSILGDPRRAETQSIMNLKIKYRESFRPFAPSVLLEEASDYFDIRSESPYMLLVIPVAEHRRLKVKENNTTDLLEKVNETRSEIPAVTHIDYSARVQTVRREDHPLFYEVIKQFEIATGVPVIVNTSFNVRGEPIVCTPQDAYLCFMRTEMDLLVMEDCILRKEDQPPFKRNVDWKSEFVLD